MATANSFIGQGWGFPPRFRQPDQPPLNQPPATGGVEMVTGVADIEQSLYVLFTTRVGERVLVPDYGTTLPDQVFEAIDAGLEAQLAYQVRLAVLDHEPRINVEDVAVSEAEELPGLLLIELTYQVRGANSRHNYVYPYYLQEASELTAPTRSGPTPAAA